MNKILNIDSVESATGACTISMKESAIASTTVVEVFLAASLALCRQLLQFKE